ncbi:hypothetical protein BCAR13_60266 [Paraburkholderia caribensis]|nr:hypothetical protein BCAR13_60266 [Paraburkholderia caribensis]
MTERQLGYLAIASGTFPRSFMLLTAQLAGHEAANFFPLPPYAYDARPGPQRDRILHVRFFAQLFLQRSGH